jgi:AcrR family transcriptional regulator
MTKASSEGCFFFKKATPSEKTKDLILEVAKKYFCEKGYEGTSVRDICVAAGANVSAIKYHFGGKEGLYRECFIHYGEERLRQSEKILTKCSTIDELKIRVKLFADDFITEGMENTHITKMICREIEIENPLIQDIFQSTFLRTYNIFVDCLADAQTKGFIRSDVNPILLTSIFFNTLTNAIRNDHIGEKHFNRTLKRSEHKEELINNLITITFDGIKIQEQ